VQAAGFWNRLKKAIGIPEPRAEKFTRCAEIVKSANFSPLNFPRFRVVPGGQAE
jgi:hypothetical protein